MMKMSGRTTSCCVALLLTFATVSAVQRELRSINDLNEDSRELLCWFANKVDIDMNGVIRLTFDPNSGDYGSHHYSNFEGLLDQLPGGYRYYTLGNINQRTSLQVPSQGRNKARLVIRVMEQNAGRQSQIIDRVYITRHYEPFVQGRSAYDPAQTYQITIRLLEEIRGLQTEMHDNSLMHHFGIANTSQFLDTRNSQAATRRNEHHNFQTNSSGVPKWLLVLVGVLILLVILIIVIFVANKKNQ